jgi:hypothetical protein
MFAEHGNVLEVAIVKDKRTGNQQGKLGAFWLFVLATICLLDILLFWFEQESVSRLGAHMVRLCLTTFHSYNMTVLHVIVYNNLVISLRLRVFSLFWAVHCLEQGQHAQSSLLRKPGSIVGTGRAKSRPFPIYWHIFINKNVFCPKPLATFMRLLEVISGFHWIDVERCWWMIFHCFVIVKRGFIM